MGLEPTTATLATWRSTTELHPRNSGHPGLWWEKGMRILLSRTFYTDSNERKKALSGVGVDVFLPLTW